MAEKKDNFEGMYFKAFVPLVPDKSGAYILEKEIDGVKQKYLLGQASNTMVDKEDERVSKKFIAKMQKTALGINVFAEHTHTIMKTLGYVSDVGGTTDVFKAETHLEPEDENDLVKSVLMKIAHGTKLGYSIGGRVTKTLKEHDDTLDKDITVLDDGDIFEISVTAMPAGEETFVGAIIKSLSKDKINAVEEIKPLKEVPEKPDKPIAKENLIEVNSHFIKSFMLAWSSQKDKLEDQRDQMGLKIKQVDMLSEKFMKGEIDEAKTENMILSFQKVNDFEKEFITNEGDENSDSDAVLLKILEEMAESDAINDDLWDMFWTFRSAIYRITFDDDLDPASKGAKINEVASEFATLVETFSSRLAELAEIVETQLSD